MKNVSIEIKIQTLQKPNQSFINYLESAQKMIKEYMRLLTQIYLFASIPTKAIGENNYKKNL